MPGIQLSNSSKRALVSSEDVAAVNKHDWFVKSSARVSYVATSVREGTKVSTLRLHVFIAKRMGKSPTSSQDVHHKNSDPYDCRRENLEVMSSTKNRSIS